MTGTITNLRESTEELAVEDGPKDSSGSTKKLPPVEKVQDPWKTAQATEDPNPKTYPNPFKSRDSQASESGPTKNSRQYTGSTTEEPAPVPELKNPAELKKNAKAALEGLINPICGFKGWEPLTEDESTELADAAVDTGIFPDWIWHPVLRLIGVSSKIITRRVRRVHTVNTDTENAA